MGALEQRHSKLLTNKDDTINVCNEIEAERTNGGIEALADFRQALKNAQYSQAMFHCDWSKVLEVCSKKTLKICKTV